MKIDRLNEKLEKGIGMINAILTESCRAFTRC